MAQRYGWWRYFWCGGSVVAVACLLIAAVNFFVPPPQLLWPSPAYGQRYRGADPIGIVTLHWRDGSWGGRAGNFPSDTVTHFRINTAHSFFVVHLADGRMLALTDRSNHLGQRVYWYERSAPGFWDRDAGSAYRADGQRLAGPARRALDPYPLTIVGDQVRIADRAVCPTEAQLWEAWCR